MAVEAQIQAQFLKSDGRSSTSTFRNLAPARADELIVAKKFAQLLLKIKNATAIKTYSLYTGEKAEYVD